MNAVEIEEEVSKLAAAPFDAQEFPFSFLEAFDTNLDALKRLRAHPRTDIEGAVLQPQNIHLCTCPLGEVRPALARLRESGATRKQRVKFILATDGVDFEAENVVSGEPLACAFRDFPEHFGFFLPLAGISTVKQLTESAFDVKATGRLNKLYVELTRSNPEWATDARRAEMNHFMARLIFCFFAENTDIFLGDRLFTRTLAQFSAPDSSNTHEVISEIFAAMNIQPAARAHAPRDAHAGREKPFHNWADAFPYVNGGLFSGSTEVPRFTKIARSYLLHVGNLDWRQINPDIFGSMIQAVVDDAERAALGMHYTSVPNILKVLNPLFLDELRARLAAAADSPQKLLNLRKRLAKIRVFDPACGSGNFLVIAYKELRAIEAEVNKRRGETDRPTGIPLTNFRGIELRDFPAQIARLALVIAQFQCDVQYLGQKEALSHVLPLDRQNWITCGNALRLDWLSICPPTGTTVQHAAEDLFHLPNDQVQVDFDNEGGETYLCGNPPYLGSQRQTPEQKSELKAIFDGRSKTWGSMDYIAGWFMKAADYGTHTHAAAAFVSTNSICQGRQIENLWPLIFDTGHEIAFAHTSFKWHNLASHKAGVTVVIVGIAKEIKAPRRLFSISDRGEVAVKEAEYINAYLISGPNVIVRKVSNPLNGFQEMYFGNMPNDGGHLLLTR